ncbi:MAG: DNA replication complex GINS family protein [Candidatus Diapherotrites archaeon]|uniref:DNA replication complex GINS family protein n=1 Tax=Candidatus Iainarchaeum sp. TaxID=3101447 RepID=A0A8T3YK61_9ARCH|nr:DNA replication complex GINS family protein [Candidatus Diapherotrites archaeon]
MELDYDEVRRIHRLEKNSSKLVDVGNEFYNDLHSFIVGEKKGYLDSLRDLSSTKARDFTNLKKMVEEIFALRTKKIMNRALVASRTSEGGEEGMAVQERKLYREFLGLLNEHGKLLSGIFSGDSAPDSGKDLNTLSVEILSDVPGFVGADMQEYGPFQKGRVVILPLKVAKLLSARKLAEVRS